MTFDLANAREATRRVDNLSRCLDDIARKEETVAITFGNVPHPPYERRIITNENGGSFDQGYPRSNVGTCVHRMDGTLDGTDGFFRNPPQPPALTDYGIGGALDPGKDGLIYMWNDPAGSIVPRANGNGGIEGDGQAFLDAYGGEAVNSRLVSIELSGCSGDPLSSAGCRDVPQTEFTAAQFESMCRLIAYWHDQARVPWDRFPVNPQTGVVTQMQHYEFSSKACPWSNVRDRTSEYQNRVKEIMRSYQEGTTPAAVDANDAVTVTRSTGAGYRAQPKEASTLLGVMDRGFDFCVERTATPIRDPATGLDWILAVVNGHGGKGYVRLVDVGLLADEGCAAGPAPFPEAGSFVRADIVRLTEARKLRDAPDGAAIGDLPVDAILVLDGPKQFKNGYYWYQHRSRFGYGWVGAGFLEDARVPNYSINPSVSTDLTGILTLGGATVTRSSDGRARVVCDGSRAGQGVVVRGPRAGQVHPKGGPLIGLFDAGDASVAFAQGNCAMAVVYTDGTSAIVYAPGRLIRAGMDRYYTDVLRTDAAKTVQRMDLYVRTPTATAVTFFVDNADIVGI
jgi:hypothetical protein